MSSAGKKYITNEEAVPVVNSDIFLGHENSQFALGVFGPDDILSYRPGTIAQAYLQLRANVYIDQTNMLDNKTKRLDGTEIDEDDERSTHFVVIENKIGRVAVFACMRLIEKKNNDELPIENFFPGAFNTRAPQNSVEVSRFIVRHDKPRYCGPAKRELMTAGLAHVFKNNLGPIFGVIEPGFERDLSIMGVPMRKVAEPKLVHEYNDENLGVEIDRYSFRDRIGEDNLNRMSVPIGSFVYWGRMSNRDEQTNNEG